MTNHLASRGYQQFLANVRDEALRPDGVLPRGWMIQPQPPYPQPRSSRWQPPAQHDLGWERMNLAFMAAITTLLALLVVVSIG